MIGTYVNVLAVIVGSGIGLFLNKRFPDRIKKVVFQALGVITLFLGVKLALGTDNLLILIFSVLLGAIVGELLDIERWFGKGTEFLKKKIKVKDNRFSEGLVTAFLIFCVGSLTILGSLQDGLTGDATLLYTKSVLDGFTSVALSSALGVGVLFSIVPLFLFQGGITLLAASLKPFLTATMITELSATGGILIMCMGVRMLEIKRIRVLNLLPALVVAVILAYFFG